MGASLGGLAMLHAHCRYPDAFDGLFLQSGSFFSPRFDRHEERFSRYRRITRFVAETQSGGLPRRAVPAILTCGAIEENIENNRLMTAALRARRYPATLRELPDVHNYTAWRDAFDPHLTQLLWQAGP
jgi:enterochelin esterase family protein